MGEKYSGPFDRKVATVDRIADVLTGKSEVDNPTGNRLCDSLDRIADYIEEHGGGGGGGGGESGVVGIIEAPVWKIAPCISSGAPVDSSVYEADFDAIWEAPSSSFRVTLTNGPFRDVHDEEGEGQISKTYMAPLNNKYTMKLGYGSEYDYVDVLVYDSPLPLLLPDFEFIQAAGMDVAFMRARAEGKDSVTNLFVNSNDAYALEQSVDVYILWNSSTQTATLSEESASTLADIINFHESLEQSIDDCYFSAHTDAYDVPGWLIPVNINEVDGKVDYFSAQRRISQSWWVEDYTITPVRNESEIVTGFTVSINRYEQEPDDNDGR